MPALTQPRATNPDNAYDWRLCVPSLFPDMPQRGCKRVKSALNVGANLEVYEHTFWFADLRENMDAESESISDPIVFIDAVFKANVNSNSASFVVACPVLRKPDLALLLDFHWNQERLAYSSFEEGEGGVEEVEPDNGVFADYQKGMKYFHAMGIGEAATTDIRIKIPLSRLTGLATICYFDDNVATPQIPIPIDTIFSRVHLSSPLQPTRSSRFTMLGFVFASENHPATSQFGVEALDAHYPNNAEDYPINSRRPPALNACCSVHPVWCPDFDRQAFCPGCKRWKEIGECVIVTATPRHDQWEAIEPHQRLAFIPAVRGPISVSGLSGLANLPLADVAHHLDIWPLTYLQGTGYFRDRLRSQQQALAGLPATGIRVNRKAVEEGVKLGFKDLYAQSIVGAEFLDRLDTRAFKGFRLPVGPRIIIRNIEDCKQYVTASVIEETKRADFGFLFECVHCNTRF